MGKNHNKLPDFLIIGAMRSGTSWLAKLLASHPRIFLPDVEVHFFDKHYAKGLDWYGKHFRKAIRKDQKCLTGEKTPEYLSRPDVPERVRKDLPEAKFIAILRDPVERAISQYKNHCQYTGYEGTFEDYLEKNPDVFERGCYARQIRRWFECFPRERFLFLVFESVTENPEEMLQTLGDFLQVDPEGFDTAQAGKTVNASYMPSFHKIYTLGSSVNRFFFRHGYHRISRCIVQCGQVFKMLKKEESPSIFVPDAVRKDLKRRYEPEVDDLRKLLGEDLAEWKGEK
jgi:hypothetical protein